MKKKISIIFILTVILIISGCGKKEEPDKIAEKVSRFSAPTVVMTNFTESLKDRDFKKAWSYLSEKTRANYMPPEAFEYDETEALANFEKIMSQRLGDEIYELELISTVVDSEEVIGEKAIVKMTYTRMENFENPDPKDDKAETTEVKIPFVLTDNGWKIYTGQETKFKVARNGSLKNKESADNPKPDKETKEPEKGTKDTIKTQPAKKGDENRKEESKGKPGKIEESEQKKVEKASAVKKNEESKTENSNKKTEKVEKKNENKTSNSPRNK